MDLSKFQSTLGKTGTFIKDNKKPLLYVGGAIAIVVIGLTVVKKLRNLVSGQNVVGGNYTQQTVDTTKTKISELTAKNYAEQLFKAFNYYWGTDLATIKSIFSKINSEDFKMIYNAYGQRTYSSINGGTPSQSPIGLDNPWIFGKNPDLDLVGWLQAELGLADFVTKGKVKPIVEGAGFVFS
jgi:hypothetical protein